ncbi:copper amine oxidase N-terminal domain-containing protein [Paenibacillus sambharensis]|nr:copper amine oxidase N-terminal domain-containing protein [Paenibacillus sambharensis]
MKRTRLITFAAAVIILMAAIIPQGSVSATSPISVYVNGSKLAFTSPPILQNGSVLVPMRPIFEALGADVSWNQDTSTVVAASQQTKIELTIGRWIAKKNGKDISLLSPAFIRNKSTYVPLRFVSEALGAAVKWDAKRYSVTITSQSGSGGGTSKGYSLQKAWSLGPPSETYDWIQGFTIGAHQTTYAMDGIKIKARKDGKERVYFSLKNLAPKLEEYGLNDPATIHSFRLSDMQERDGRLYVSGLLFLNKENEQYEYYNQNILLLGFTYNLIFYIEDGQPHLVYVERAVVNEKPDNFTWYETSSGQPENILQWGDFYLYDYSRYLLKLRFTFMEDGSLIVPRELAQRHYLPNEGGGQSVSHSYHSVIRIHPDGQIEELTSWGSHLGSIREYSHVYTTDRHVLPVLKNGELTLYTGNGYIMKEQLHSGQRTFTELPEEDSYEPQFLMERPLYHKGKLYFLNDKGIFTLDQDQPRMLIPEPSIDFTGMDHTVYIVDFDYDGKHFYISDFTTRTIYKLVPSA